MSLGEVDTLNLLSDKLNNLFDESQDYTNLFLMLTICTNKES